MSRRNYVPLEQRIMDRRKATGIILGSMGATAAAACNVSIPGSNIAIPSISDAAGPAVGIGTEEPRIEEHVFVAKSEEDGQCCFISSIEDHMNSVQTHPDLLKTSTPTSPGGLYDGESILVKFDLRRNHDGDRVNYDGMSIQRAHLRLILHGDVSLQQGPQEHKFQFVGLSVPWDEETVTFANAGGILTPAGHNSNWDRKSSTETERFKVISIDLTDLEHTSGQRLVDYWTENPNENHGLLVNSYGQAGSLRSFYRERAYPLLKLGLGNWTDI